MDQHTNLNGIGFRVPSLRYLYGHYKEVIPNVPYKNIKESGQELYEWLKSHVPIYIYTHTHNDKKF